MYVVTYLLLNKNILGVFTLKGIVGYKSNMGKIMRCAFERLGNMMKKGGNAGKKHFLTFSHNVFKRLLHEDH